MSSWSLSRFLPIRGTPYSVLRTDIDYEGVAGEHSPVRTVTTTHVILLGAFLFWLTG